MKRADGGMAAGSAVGAIGVALAALAGTLCCAGPAVIAIVGAGGALAAAKLEPYRPYFLGASVVMLAFGFWRAYRPTPVGGAACSIRTGRLVRGVLWTAAVLTLLSALAPRLWS
jgi:mercuric ion transport protein